MMVENFASLHTLQEHPGVLWNPLGRDGVFGEKKGLLARIVDKFGSFLFEDIRDLLGKTIEEIGQLLMTG